MADLAQLERALINADKAGDAQGATVLAGEIRRMRAETAAPKPPIETPAFEQEASKILSTTGPELLAGSAPGRFVQGVASPLTWAAQAAANTPMGKFLGADKWVNEKIANLDEMTKRGMAAQPSEGGFVPPVSPLMAAPGYLLNQAASTLGNTDVAGMAGGAMSPLSLGAMKIAPAASIFGRIGQGAGIGGAVGVANPIKDGGENFWEDSARHGGIGLGLGAAIPGAMEAGKLGYKAVRNIAEPLLAGRDMSVGRTLNKAAGSKRDSIISALRQPSELVPGSPPSAGEAAANIGTPEFAAIQEIMKKRNPAPYDEMGQAAQKARDAHIGRFAGDRNKLADAIEARDVAAAEQYGRVRADQPNLESGADIVAKAIAERQAAYVKNLQNAGRYDTVAAQQENLANGGMVNLRGDRPATSNPPNAFGFTGNHSSIPGQVANTPEMQVGALGGQARSPSAWPVEGHNRIPGRYTHNIDRVPEARQAADDFRWEAELASLDRDILKSHGPLETRSIADMLKRPSVAKGIEHAKLSAQENPAYFPQSGDQRMNVGNLQRVKESLDAGVKSAIGSKATGGFPELSPQELGKTRREFIELLSAKSPGWRAGRENYANASGKINQMEIGQALQSRLSDGGGRPTADRFLSAIDERAGRDEALIKQVLKNPTTGDPRYSAIQDALEPQNYRIVQDVAADIKRALEYERLANVGEPAATKIIGGIAPKAGGWGMFSPKVSVTRAVLNRISGLAEGKSLDRLSEVMRDPKLSAQLMQAATPSERAMIANEWGIKGGRVATIAAALAEQMRGRK